MYISTDKRVMLENLSFNEIRTNNDITQKKKQSFGINGKINIFSRININAKIKLERKRYDGRQ